MSFSREITVNRLCWIRWQELNYSRKALTLHSRRDWYNQSLTLLDRKNSSGRSKNKTEGNSRLNARNFGFKITLKTMWLLRIL